VSLDAELFVLINQHWTHPVLDWWAALVRASELWLVPAVVTAAVVWWRGSARARSACMLCLLVLAIGDGCFVRTLKIVSARPRPSAVLSDVRSVRLARVEPRVRALAMPLLVERLEAPSSGEKPRSFPSGHAWNSFAIATVITLFSRRWGWLAFLPAFAVGLARVHAGLHWPSDVLASAVLSPPCTLGLVVVLERAWLAVAPPAWRDRLPGVLRA
jgi:undecaprenyl-diphosphatase